MSELHQPGETTPPASETAASTPHDAGSGPAPADNPGSYPDAAPGDDFAGYSDADIDAILAAEDQLPEPRTRQEAAADTWDGDPDDPGGSDRAAEYDADVAEFLAAEDQLPEPRTRQEAAADTWDDATQPGDDDQGSFSGDPASEYDGDVAALLAAEDQLPEPRTRQEAAAATWDDTNTSQGGAPDTSPDGTSPEQQAPSEAEPGPASLGQNVSETTVRTGDGNETETRQDQDQQAHSPEEPTAEERARLDQLYQEYLKEQRSGWDQGTNVVGDKPSRSPGDTSNLPPTGEKLLEMEDDSASHLEKLHRKIYERMDDISDAFGEYGGDLGQLFERPPTQTHTEVSAAPHQLPTHQEHGVDGGHLATAGLVIGVLGFELFRAINNRVRAWRER